MATAPARMIAAAIEGIARSGNRPGEVSSRSPGVREGEPAGGGEGEGEGEAAGSADTPQKGHLGTPTAKVVPQREQVADPEDAILFQR